MTAETRDELHTILDALIDALERTGATIEIGAEDTKQLIDKLYTERSEHDTEHNRS